MLLFFTLFRFSRTLWIRVRSENSLNVRMVFPCGWYSFAFWLNKILWLQFVYRWSSTITVDVVMALDQLLSRYFHCSAFDFVFLGLSRTLLYNFHLVFDAVVAITLSFHFFDCRLHLPMLLPLSTAHRWFCLKLWVKTSLYFPVDTKLISSTLTCLCEKWNEPNRFDHIFICFFCLVALSFAWPFQSIVDRYAIVLVEQPINSAICCLLFTSSRFRANKRTKRSAAAAIDESI